jgi:DNA-binding winged helix-turn-helix (wHTH) protein
MPERRFGTERGRHPVGRFGLVPRDDLIAYVFGDAEADGISLQRLATALRRRMLDAGCKLSVETVPRVGYRVGSGSLIPTGPAEDSPQGS